MRNEELLIRLTQTQGIAGQSQQYNYCKRFPLWQCVIAAFAHTKKLGENAVVSHRQYRIGNPSHDPDLIWLALIYKIKLRISIFRWQTSQLPFISLEAPKHVIGSNTIDCMKSGSLFGNAAMIDGMIRRIRKELGENAIVVATGGIASAILPYCEENISYDPDLMLKGLALIYKKNQTR